MATLTMRPYQGESDQHPIVDLLNICETIDCEDSYYSLIGLQQEFTSPGFDPTRDVCLWQDANGQLVGFAQLWIPTELVDEADGHLWFRVHPNARNQGIEPEIIHWAESRIRQVGRTKALPAKLAVSCRDYQIERIALFERQGFTYDRCFLRMARSLSAPIPAPQFPDGFTLVDATSEFDDQASVEMYNQTFIDHWNFHPLTVEEIHHFTSDPLYRPELDLVAIAPDGTYASFCFCYIDYEENRHKGKNEGWVSRLGTRRGFRRLGLGRAMLLVGLHRLKTAGMETALLGVDTRNPNQAYDLYESIGFCKRFANFYYAKPISG
ncbi:MAG: GNAT family N-acetyltransferase [Cyanobacteria bacterium CRU_2_1]|nr:GNAT family N-acetyltransferase [Cyanobacteria bacterium RU_5_0]NJR63833.1 GNAT family N-acetyltransferase [Cyanobacteria bacterium CRU_2_1]